MPSVGGNETHCFIKGGKTPNANINGSIAIINTDSLGGRIVDGVELIIRSNDEDHIGFDCYNFQLANSGKLVDVGSVGSGEESVHVISPLVEGWGQIPKATPSGTLWLNNTRWRQAKNKKLKLLVRCIVPNEIFANILGGHRQAVSK